ncbi:MAG TPA: hypothetical protein VKP88_01455 [Candidatus Paceibacterota bacterium]|nr:hypothetical protein [Candidatus Paceibacterota bacterium]
MAYRSLEKHPWFPYIAWGTVIGFALFVGSLTLSISKDVAALEAYSHSVQTGL